MPAPLLIADVPWLLYRAFFSLPKSIVGVDGQPVNALLGTVNALLAVLEARPAEKSFSEARSAGSWATATDGSNALMAAMNRSGARQ